MGSHANLGRRVETLEKPLFLRERRRLADLIKASRSFFEEIVVLQHLSQSCDNSQGRRGFLA
jgi:hypothetical protein